MNRTRALVTLALSAVVLTACGPDHRTTIQEKLPTASEGSLAAPAVTPTPQVTQPAPVVVVTPRPRTTVPVKPLVTPKPRPTRTVKHAAVNIAPTATITAPAPTATPTYTPDQSETPYWATPEASWAATANAPVVTRHARQVSCPEEDPESCPPQTTENN